MVESDISGPRKLGRRTFFSSRISKSDISRFEVQNIFFPSGPMVRIEVEATSGQFFSIGFEVEDRFFPLDLR